MKIYIVVIERKDGSKYVAPDWIGDSAYEAERQEVFLSYDQAREVFEGVCTDGVKALCIHEFEV